MKTVKEVAALTGISVRTLQYYDEIGVFKPTTLTEAGYRLYDEEALKTLQQILLFRAGFSAEGNQMHYDTEGIRSGQKHFRSRRLC